MTSSTLLWRGPLVRKLQGNDLVLSSAYQDYDDLCDLVREGKLGSIGLGAAATALEPI